MDVFERVKAGEVVRALNSTPPQHGKTELELHELAQLMLLRPHQTHALIMHTASLAESKSALCRDYARAAGVQLRNDTTAKREWRTIQGGGLLAVGIGGPLMGQTIDGLLVIDDPYKNRPDAESETYRRTVRQFFDSVAETRIHKTTSVVVTHTRFVPNDLIGTLSEERDLDDPDKPRYEVHNLQAIDENGIALCEDLHPLRMLREVQARNEYDWWSMYMGSPRPRGQAVFSDPRYFDELPDSSAFSVAIGIDLAYTAKTHADYSVAVVMAAYDAPDLGPDAQRYYIVDVVRVQVQAPDFMDRLQALADTWSEAPMIAYAYGPEIGSVDWLRHQGLPIRGKSMGGDKFVRAQPVAAAWKRGRVLVPRNQWALDPDLPESEGRRPPPWLKDFLTEVSRFTGVSDVHDDQVDAMAPAFDRLARHVDSGGALPPMTKMTGGLGG